MFAIFASVFSGNLEGSEEYFEVYIPGYFTTVIYIVSMFMIGYQMVDDKEEGIYKRLKVTPFDIKDIRIYNLCNLQKFKTGNYNDYNNILSFGNVR
jgi:ABC-type multidrug transport system permease subunit